MITLAVALALVSPVGWEQTTTEAYVVQPDDTLSSIDKAEDSPGPWTRLAYVNRDKFQHPDVIEAGTVLLIPGSDGKRLDYTPLAPPVVATTSGSSGSSGYSGSVWDALAECESGGDWSADTGNGYAGGLQHSPSTWTSHGGEGSPADASREEQIAVAERVQASQGWGAWPACSAELGLR